MLASAAGDHRRAVRRPRSDRDIIGNAIEFDVDSEGTTSVAPAPNGLRRRPPSVPPLGERLAPSARPLRGSFVAHSDNRCLWGTESYARDLATNRFKVGATVSPGGVGAESLFSALWH